MIDADGFAFAYRGLVDAAARNKTRLLVKEQFIAELVARSDYRLVAKALAIAEAKARLAPASQVEARALELAGLIYAQPDAETQPESPAS